MGRNLPDYVLLVGTKVRGDREGKVHLLEDVSVSTLCGTMPFRGWRREPPQVIGLAHCKTCVKLAEKHGIEWPT